MTPFWTLSKEFRFEASHQLPHHDGKCRRLHGHSWRGMATVCGTKLEEAGSKQGMVVDYGDLSALLKPLVEEYLDHHHLNDSLGLESPTSEAIAQWVHAKLRPRCPGLVSITVEETCTSRCEYRPL